MVKITKSTPLRIPRSLLSSNVVLSSLSSSSSSARRKRFLFLFPFSRDRSRSFVFVGRAQRGFFYSPISYFSLSLLHRRRLRRWPDHGHDRFEVPAHRGELFSLLFYLCARVKERALLSSPLRKKNPLSEHTSAKEKRVRRRTRSSSSSFYRR